jgi:hypothetical protein
VSHGGRKTLAAPAGHNGPRERLSGKRPRQHEGRARGTRSKRLRIRQLRDVRLVTSRRAVCPASFAPSRAAARWPPGRGDPFATRAIVLAPVAAGLVAVECDHVAIRGAVIAFLTERSCQRRAWISLLGKARAVARAREPGAAPLPSRVCTSPPGSPSRIKSRRQALGVHRHNPSGRRRGSARADLRDCGRGGHRSKLLTPTHDQIAPLANAHTACSDTVVWKQSKSTPSAGPRVRGGAVESVPIGPGSPRTNERLAGAVLRLLYRHL